MKSQINPTVAIVVIVVVVIAILGVMAMKTGDNAKRLDTGINTDKFAKDPAGAKKSLMDDIAKYKDAKGGN